MQIVVALIIVLAAAVPALAQGIAPLRDALSKIPHAMLDSPANVQLYFVDMAALRQLGGGEGLSPQAVARVAIGGNIVPFVAIGARGLDYWTELSRVDIKDVRYLATVGVQPSVWGFVSEETAASTIAALDARDFDPVGPLGMLGNEGEDGRVLAPAAPLDPWRGTRQRPSFLAAKGSAIVQVIAPFLLELVLRDGPTMADSAIVDAALGGLEAALGEGELVQAMLVTPALGLRGVNGDVILNNLSPTLQDLVEALESQRAPGTQGIPAYLRGFVADTQAGDQPGVLISLAYADCTTAERAAAQLAVRFAEIIPADLTVHMEQGVHAAADGLCAASLGVKGTSTDGIGNATFKTFIERRRWFEILEIGDEP